MNALLRTPGDARVRASIPVLSGGRDGLSRTELFAAVRRDKRLGPEMSLEELNARLVGIDAVQDERFLAGRLTSVGFNSSRRPTIWRRRREQLKSGVQTSWCVGLWGQDVGGGDG
ncbi:hypothetical protein ACWD5Q_08115 [Streptomyces sp. NPDC002513]